MTTPHATPRQGHDKADHPTEVKPELDPGTPESDQPKSAKPTTDERLDALETLLLAPDSEHVAHHTRLAESGY